MADRDGDADAALRLLDEAAPRCSPSEAVGRMVRRRRAKIHERNGDYARAILDLSPLCESGDRRPKMRIEMTSSPPFNGARKATGREGTHGSATFVAKRDTSPVIARSRNVTAKGNQHHPKQWAKGRVLDATSVER